MLRHLLSLAVALTITLADHGTEEGFVEINLADVDPGRCTDLSIELPFVCGVNFTGIIHEGSSFYEYDRNETVTSFTSPFNTTREDQPQLTVHLTFINDTGRIACRRYIFNRSLTADSLVFQCEPVRQCGEPPLDGNVTTWKKFLNDTETREFIKEPVDGTPDLTGDPLTPTRNIATTQDALGYYVPFLLVDSMILPGQVFAIYLNPEFTSDDDRNYTVVEGRNTDAIVCSIRSFPPVTATWEFSRSLTGLDEGNSTITAMPGRDFVNINRTNFRLTFDGQIVITNAGTEDHGFYRCTAVNEASGHCAIRTRILRVRDKLRPLWPALGLILTLMSVAVIIVVNSLIEKHRGEKKLPLRLEEEDFDGEVNDRLNSVSDADSPFGGKEHAAIRRISSARQELIPSS